MQRKDFYSLLFSSFKISTPHRMLRLFRLFFIPLLFLLTSCQHEEVIVSQIEEREANVIVVFLESRGIQAQKLLTSSGTEIGGGASAPKYNISVPSSQSISAMAVLNQNGLPRKQGITLLDLFAKQGLMSSDKEETVRFQAGLAQQITNTIMMIDGVIDASVQLAFPATDIVPGQVQTERVTAAIFIKHQGIIDDPNSHLENKIKRIVSASIPGLDVNDVTVVSDRSRFTDILVDQKGEMILPRGNDLVSIWSITLNKQSAGRFRTIFFTLTLCTLFLAAILGWLTWKFYPQLRQKGILMNLLRPFPMGTVSKKKEPPETKLE